MPHDVGPRGRARSRSRELRAQRPGPGDRQPQGEALRPGHRRGDVDGDDVFDTGECGDRGGDPVPRDGDGRTVVTELVGHLGRGVERVVLDDDGSEPEHGVERDDVLGAVRQDERHPVARTDAEPTQAFGRHVDLAPELGVGQLGAEELERRTVAVGGHGSGQQVDE